jgi:DNA replication protein DnaC
MVLWEEYREVHPEGYGYSRFCRGTRPRTRRVARSAGLLLEHELTLRRQKRFETRARAAWLRHPVSIEDLDYRTHRGLDRASLLKLAACDWIRTRRNLLITVPCGVGKGWLSCA